MSLNTVLIADDDKAIRTILSHALVRAGYEVRTTGNVADTLELDFRWGRGLGNYRCCHAPMRMDSILFLELKRLDPISK